VNEQNSYKLNSIEKITVIILVGEKKDTGRTSLFSTVSVRHCTSFYSR
jgi:hypothetical protein